MCANDCAALTELVAGALHDAVDVSGSIPTQTQRARQVGVDSLDGLAAGVDGDVRAGERIDSLVGGGDDWLARRHPQRIGARRAVWGTVDNSVQLFR